jgi:peptide chain release factor subunit 3
MCNVAATPAPAPAPPATADQGDDGEDAIDENDPLWIATLKVAEGDREKAVRMLENPDALMQYPEIRAIMEAADAEAEDITEETGKLAVSANADVEEWEQNANAGVPGAVTAAVDEEAVETALSPAKSVASSAAATATDYGDEGEAEVAVVLQEVDPREQVNLVFIGHVDAGKSTLSGCILFNMGKVDARTIERFEREAKQRNRESWFLAFIMDTSEEERAKGITVEVGRAHFETDVYRYTILDAPGHKNYVPNMISGASQADVGILVISARKGEFETGFEKGGQTREHALLAKTLGVQFLIVVINKMDDPTVQWDVARYEECVGKLKPFLKSCGYVIKNEVKFMPISGLKGYNILNEVPEDVCPWWKQMYTTGAHNTKTPTLLSTFDNIKLTGRNSDAPLRIPCLDRYFERGCVVMGKVCLHAKYFGEGFALYSHFALQIEAGTLRIGDEVAIAPTKKKSKVEAIFVGEIAVRNIFVTRLTGC